MRMRRDQGTVFIDTLIAAAIVATTLGMMYRVVADTAHRDAGLNDRRAAALVAQSELASVGAELALTPGTTEGTQGPFAWRVEIAPYGTEGVNISTVGRLLAVTVSVARPDGPPLVILKTLRIVGDS